MFKKFAVSAVAGVLLAASAGLAQESWPCGVEQDFGIPVTCVLDEDGMFRIRGQGAMRDYPDPLETYGPWPGWWWGQRGVDSVVIESGVTHIGAYAFSMYNIRKVTILAHVPPTAGTDAFKQGMSTAILLVPQANIDAYRDADVWKDFGYINPSTVKFNSLGGTAVDSQFISYGSKVTKPADPTKEDHVFDGWAIVMIGGGPIPWNFEDDIVTSEVTLIALWTSNTSVTHGVRAASAAASRVTVRNNTLTVRSSSPESVSRVRLIDMRGKSVASFTARGAGSFSLGNIPAGRYFVEVRDAVGRSERGSVVVGVR